MSAATILHQNSDVIQRNYCENYIVITQIYIIYLYNNNNHIEFYVSVDCDL